jgi:CheY-like chemotaxis protein
MNDGHYILIVEDSRDEREAVRLSLEIEGYHVVAVAEGREALEYMRRADPPPCMIMLDLMMRGTNGWEFRTEQLRDARLASIPVVVCSGDGRIAEKAFALGIMDNLEKPIDYDALLAVVGRYCRAAPASHSSPDLNGGTPPQP